MAQKHFSKFRQSAKISGSATTSITRFNTSLDITTSASGKFDVNGTYFSKGEHRNVLVSGTAATSSSSKFESEKRRLLQLESAKSFITLQNPSIVHVNSSVRSGSESFKLPCKSYLTLFKGQVNTTDNNIWKMNALLEGEVISRVAFANKTVSLTKSCIKAYVKSNSVDNNAIVDADNDEDNDAVASPNLFQISSIRAKTHTWTKVVSQNKTGMVLDVITCTKTRIYGKYVQRGKFVIYSGAGQVSWEKLRITIAAKRLHNLSPHEYGIHFIKQRLESSFLFQFLGSPFEMS